ncbi:MAG: hypothetical protein ACI9MC_001085 [Kiritimatiellia bacterium]|jgi:hypothetical protein
MNTHDTLGGTPSGRTFEFIHCLGRGGFGEVYLAHMFTPGLQVPAQVAIKMLHDQVTPESDAAARLKDEARVTVLLGHPGILQVLDLMELGGRLALITEYVDGQDLGDCMEQGIPRRAIVEALALVSAALGAAHKAGVVHRDVKPANIRIGRHGQCKLLDFGIAHASTLSREAQTASGLIVGSQGYMSPERLRGIVHGGADIFAVGCVLYEGLTGHRLFENIGPGHLVGICFDKDVYDEFIGDKLAKVKAPRTVVSLLQQCLEHDPSKRIDGGTLATRLQQVAPRLRGEALGMWCRERAWPQTAVVEGSLTGATLSEWAPPAPAGSITPHAPIAPDGPTKPLTPAATERSSRMGLWVSLAAMPVVFSLFLLFLLVGSAAAAVAGSLWYSGALAEDPPMATADNAISPDADAVALSIEPEPTITVIDALPTRPDHALRAPIVRTLAITPPASIQPLVDPATTTIAEPADVPTKTESAKPAAEPSTPASTAPFISSATTTQAAPKIHPDGGEVAVTGGVNVRLIATDGAVHSPGTLAAGTYSIQAWFRERWQDSGRVSVQRGSRIELFCSDRMQRCVLR